MKIVKVIMSGLIYLTVICACSDSVAPVVTPTPCTRGTTVICELPDGSGIIMATHASQMPDSGWEVLGDILVVPGSEWVVVENMVMPQSNDAYTIPGPTKIAPGSQCVVVE